jgi:hypothetical protein
VVNIAIIAAKHLKLYIPAVPVVIKKRKIEKSEDNVKYVLCSETPVSCVSVGGAWPKASAILDICRGRISVRSTFYQVSSMLGKLLSGGSITCEIETNTTSPKPRRRRVKTECKNKFVPSNFVLVRGVFIPCS